MTKHIHIHIHRGNAKDAKRTPSAILRKHSMWSESDYDYFVSKGYSDKEILALWDRDAKSGNSPVTHKKAPDVVGMVTGRKAKDTKILSEKSQAIENRYKQLKSKSKEDILKIFQSKSRLDMSHAKSEPKEVLITSILESEFRRREIDAWGDELNGKTKDSPVEIRPQLEQLKRFVTVAKRNPWQQASAKKLAQKILKDIESISPNGDAEIKIVKEWKQFVQSQISQLQ